MADAVIKNVRKDDDGDIASVGVSGQWEWTVTKVVASIEKGDSTFFVNCPRRADVYVEETPAGHKFLKSKADTTTKNNLDELPPFDRARTGVGVCHDADDERGISDDHG